MKKITDSVLVSYTFSKFNILEKMNSIYKNIDKYKIDKSKLDDIILYIKKSYFIQSKNIILDFFNSDKSIIVRLDNVEESLPSSIYGFVVNTDNKFISIMDISQYCNVKVDKITNTKNYDILDKILYSYLQFGLINLITKLSPNTIFYNQSLIKTGAECYAKLFFRPFDKEFAVGSNFAEIDKLYGILGYYYAKNIMGSKYALNIASSMDILTSKTETATFLTKNVDHEKFNNINDLINTIKSNIIGCSSLTLQTFLSRSSILYGPQIYLATDTFLYFANMLSSVYVGANIVKDTFINSILKNLLDEFYSQLFTLIEKGFKV